MSACVGDRKMSCGISAEAERRYMSKTGSRLPTSLRKINGRQAEVYGDVTRSVKASLVTPSSSAHAKTMISPGSFPTWSRVYRRTLAPFPPDSPPDDNINPCLSRSFPPPAVSGIPTPNPHDREPPPRYPALACRTALRPPRSPANVAHTGHACCPVVLPTRASKPAPRRI
ncbi:hypothetical protein C8F04DRAFT_1181998 [Mycena alexandri]|uniref:Uncharacterized protein n=1 Tax=Mycena alexandri TaxID=1745969 RepID=A0AAD6SZK5_9AGAR|nr:hypothetical protein C8F04DRAFT_1181998 [Mycena alexandri]